MCWDRVSCLRHAPSIHIDFSLWHCVCSSSRRGAARVFRLSRRDAAARSHGECSSSSSSSSSTRFCCCCRNSGFLALRFRGARDAARRGFPRKRRGAHPCRGACADLLARAGACGPAWPSSLSRFSSLSPSIPCPWPKRKCTALIMAKLHCV